MDIDCFIYSVLYKLNFIIKQTPPNFIWHTDSTKYVNVLMCNFAFPPKEVHIL